MRARPVALPSRRARTSPAVQLRSSVTPTPSAIACACSRTGSRCSGSRARATGRETRATSANSAARIQSSDRVRAREAGRGRGGGGRIRATNARAGARRRQVLGARARTRVRPAARHARRARTPPRVFSPAIVFARARQGGGGVESTLLILIMSLKAVTRHTESPSTTICLVVPTQNTGYSCRGSRAGAGSLAVSADGCIAGFSLLVEFYCRQLLNSFSRSVACGNKGQCSKTSYLCHRPFAPGGREGWAEGGAQTSSVLFLKTAPPAARRRLQKTLFRYFGRVDCATTNDHS